MRYLLFLFSLLLSVSTAFAQSEKTPEVTKLPGEENLSLRERAERDFLMPVRRKKVVTEPVRVAEDGTAAPESDVTAHASNVADDVRTVEEVATPAREARVVRHSSHRSSRSRATRSKHTSSKSSSKKASRRSHSKKSSAKKHSAKKNSSKKSSAKKTTKKSAGSKKKSSSSKKRRR